VSFPPSHCATLLIFFWSLITFLLCFSPFCALCISRGSSFYSFSSGRWTERIVLIIVPSPVGRNDRSIPPLRIRIPVSLNVRSEKDLSSSGEFLGGVVFSLRGSRTPRFFPKCPFFPDVVHSVLLASRSTLSSYFPARP